MLTGHPFSVNAAGAKAGIVFFLVCANPAWSAELPGRYFRLLEAELAPIEKSLDGDPKTAQGTTIRLNEYPGAVLAAVVLYTKQHPDNPGRGDAKKLALALKIGDLLAGGYEKGDFQKLLNHNWGTYMWLEAFRLLEKDLGAERAERWGKALEKAVQEVSNDVAARIDFPRYQAPYLLTSTNHYSLWASTVHLAGRMFHNKEWERLGAKAMRRLAAEEQTADGYWGEHTDQGPETAYNYLTLTGVALFWEHSQDKAALEALRRATTFHTYFTYPDGTPVQTIDGRNRHSHHGPSAWGHFGFSHFPNGRRYAEFLTGFLREGELGEGGASVAQTFGRIAQDALYYHEGPTAPIPQDLPRYAHRMKVEAGIRKTGPWVVCLSGLTEAPVESNPFFLDRQGHLSIFHEKLGLIVTGANSKRQPELATFEEKTKNGLVHLPFSGRLRMSDDHDRLGLGYDTFFAEATVPTPSESRLSFRWLVTETGRGRLKEARCHLQLRLHAEEVLETAKSKVTLGEKRIELEPGQLGDSIRHRGWVLKMPPKARLTWPVFPFNPYKNGPETELRHAVGLLEVPVNVQPPSEGSLPWRRQELAFTLETTPPTRTK